VIVRLRHAWMADIELDRDVIDYAAWGDGRSAKFFFASKSLIGIM
jgi:hypothetical protein